MVLGIAAILLLSVVTIAAFSNDLMDDRNKNNKLSFVS